MNVKKIKRFLSLTLVCLLFASTTAFASTKASEQIAWYDLDARAIGGGEIAIKTSITATNIMQEIGVLRINVFTWGDYGLELVESYDKDDTGMTSINSGAYNNTIYFSGEAGKTYQIVVSVFAEDKDGGSDSRSKTFSITAE